MTTDEGTPPPWANVSIMRLNDGSRSSEFANCQTRNGQFEFRVPPGRYQLHSYGTGTLSTSTQLDLGPDERERDLGVIGLNRDIIAKNIGKDALPLHVTETRGVSKDVSLADFRGKWILVEFWGYW